jgi:hypothetical protein
MSARPPPDGSSPDGARAPNPRRDREVWLSAPSGQRRCTDRRPGGGGHLAQSGPTSDVRWPRPPIAGARARSSEASASRAFLRGGDPARRHAASHRRRRRLPTLGISPHRGALPAPPVQPGLVIPPWLATVAPAPAGGGRTARSSSSSPPATVVGRLPRICRRRSISGGTWSTSRSCSSAARRHPDGSFRLEGIAPRPPLLGRVAPQAPAPYMRMGSETSCLGPGETCADSEPRCLRACGTSTAFWGRCGGSLPAAARVRCPVDSQPDGSSPLVEASSAPADAPGAA